jgi:putative pyruvate formate lyase activating enzyme
MYVEEPFLSGRAGSGGVFVSGCVQSCVFCQNFDINLERRGQDLTVDVLATRFLDLQAAGCHNLHWVSPTHELPWLVDALALARERDLRLPLVYNTGGYDSVDVLALLEGLAG